MRHFRNTRRKTGIRRTSERPPKRQLSHLQVLRQTARCMDRNDTEVVSDVMPSVAVAFVYPNLGFRSRNGAIQVGSFDSMDACATAEYEEVAKRQRFGSPG